MSRETDLAWCAGFFDGEGCTYFSGVPGSKRRISMSVGQRDERVLYKFNRIIGIGKIYYCPKYITWIGFGFIKVEIVLGLLWPYLSTVKREQAKKALEQYVNHELNGKIGAVLHKLPDFLVLD